jgi:hypothetical protein
VKDEPCRFHGLHIRQPARVDFGRFRLWCICRPSNVSGRQSPPRRSVGVG